MSPGPHDGRRVIYSLTEKGEDSLPVVLALRQWGEQWGYGSMNVRLADNRDGLAGPQNLRASLTTGAN